MFGEILQKIWKNLKYSMTFLHWFHGNVVKLPGKFRVCMWNSKQGKEFTLNLREILIKIVWDSRKNYG